MKPKPMHPSSLRAFQRDQEHNRKHIINITKPIDYTSIKPIDYIRGIMGADSFIVLEVIIFVSVEAFYTYYGRVEWHHT